ncbi:hypothetical protein GWI34_08865 [Actinomadura sp. DSM 109109]|nr:hypothetical protein [Actinomadura lepetitiana]
MKKLQLRKPQYRGPKPSEVLRQLPAKSVRLFSANRYRLATVALAALAGAIVGAIVEVLDYGVDLADLNHSYGLDLSEAGDLGYLLFKVIAGVITGVIVGGIGGVLGILSYRPTDARVRRNTFRVASAVLIAGLVICAVCVALAGFGVAVIGIPGPLGTITVGGLFIGFCTEAAGIAVGAARTRN